MCEACESTAVGPTDRTLQAEALLGVSCTCAGPGGPEFCDLHSPRMLLEKLQQLREDEDERVEAAVAAAKEEAVGEAAEAWSGAADTLRTAVDQALDELKERLTGKELPKRPANVKGKGKKKAAAGAQPPVAQPPEGAQTPLDAAAAAAAEFDAAFKQLGEDLDAAFKAFKEG